MSFMDKIRSWFGGSSDDAGHGHEHPHGQDHHHDDSDQAEPDFVEEAASSTAAAAAPPGAGGGMAPQLGSFDPEPESKEDPEQRP